MRIWLITSGESTSNGSRLMRTGMLASELIKRGNDVLWWTTTFDHQTKQYISDGERKRAVFSGIKLYYLHSRIKYNKNIGFARFFNHRGVAAHFRKATMNQPRPDLVVCSYPTIDLASEAVEFGRKAQVPVIIDVRDMWPDIFGAAVPSLAKKIGLDRILLAPLMKAKRNIFNEAAAITAVSPKYLSWALGCVKNRAWKPRESSVFELGFSSRKGSNTSQVDRALTRQRLGLGIEDIVVWFSGTFGKTYDLKPAIIAARYFMSTGSVRFVFSGDGELRKDWEDAARGLSNVTFTGWLDNEGLLQFGAVADIGLMAYRKGAPQGYPNKLFEYMALGIPLVSSLDGECKDFIEKEQIGMQYSLEQEDGLINVLKILINNSDLRYRMGCAGLKAYSDNFDPAIIYGKFADFIEKRAAS